MPTRKTPRQIGLTLDGETIVLQKFHGRFTPPSYATETWLSDNAALVRRGAGLDLETTGLDFERHRIIELAVRPFGYRVDTGEMLFVEAGYTALQDPGEPLSEEVQWVTGLTDEMLARQAIDWAEVERVLTAVELVIAHNAAFDRPFVDRALPVSLSKLWACSLKHVDWAAKGFDVHKLGILAHKHGFFVDAHRAMNDVNGMLYLLSLPDEETGRAYLGELARNAERGTVTISADGSAFDKKDLLKSRGYRWDPQRRTWFRTVYRDELDGERDWLAANVYAGAFLGTCREMPVHSQFTRSPAQAPERAF